jgi:hypothetical protein
MPNFDGTVEVTGIGAVPTPEVSVQVAVLVFLHPPATIPPEVAELTDTGADYAFVTTGLMVQPVQ